MRLCPPKAAPFSLACIVGAALALSACGPQGEKSAGGPPATPAGADEFIAGMNKDMRTMVPYLNSAQWLQATYITDDSQAVSAKANEEFLAYQSRKVQEAKRFKDVKELS